MDVAAVSVMASQYKVQQSAAVLVMKKAMDTARDNGTDLIEMMLESSLPESIDPYLGNNIDQYV